MDILEVVDRAARLERNAAEIYDLLATRFRGDPAIEGLWTSLAEEERAHATKLTAWRTLLAKEPAERRPVESGFALSLVELEGILQRARKRARAYPDLDEAFAIALDLESSELDAIYGELLHASPLAREPDLAALRERELGAHHRRLLAAVRERATDENVRLCAAILAVEDAGAHARRS